MTGTLLLVGRSVVSGRKAESGVGLSSEYVGLKSVGFKSVNVGVAGAFEVPSSANAGPTANSMASNNAALKIARRADCPVIGQETTLRLALSASGRPYTGIL